MRILTWNINRRSVESIDAICSLNADIILLQEVRAEVVDKIANRLKLAGCEPPCYSYLPTDKDKKYGNLTASRLPLSQVPRGWAPSMPWPQLALRAVVHTLFCDIDTLNIHIPNWYGSGWKKIESFEALAESLKQSCGPCVVGGDFNEPQAILPNGSFATFGQDIRSDGSVRIGERPWPDDYGCKDYPRRWDTAVRRIFEGAREHGLQHVCQVRDGDYRNLPVTHLVHGKERRFFDHLFVSGHFHVIDYQSIDSVRDNLVYSDHSVVYADVEIKKEAV